MTSPAPRVSVVIPVYNSPALAELAARLRDVLQSGAGGYEVIFVDDGSPNPAIWPALVDLAARDPAVRAVQLTRTFGQHAATLCGLAAARGDLIVTMDDDLQHDPADLPQLLAHADHDIVMAQFGERHHPLLRRLASRIKHLFDRLLLGAPRDVTLTSFRVLKRTVVSGVLATRTAHPFLPGSLFHVSRDVIGVPVPHHPRHSGRSGYTFAALVKLFSNLTINHSSLLLRASAGLGLLLALLSFTLAGVVVWRKVTQNIAVQGWASLMAAQLLFNGLLLFLVGVLGEYLLRIIEGVEQRPAYVVRQEADRPT